MGACARLARKAIFVSLAAAFPFGRGVTTAAATNHGDPGLTVKEFREFANSLGGLPGRLEAVQLLQETDGTSAVAVATYGSITGWELFVFRALGQGRYSKEWASGPLDSSFAVASADELTLFTDGGESLLAFQGCARHVCPDVFSVLLYVPSARRAFIATAIRGRITYSAGTELPQYHLYKESLDQLIRDRKSDHS